MGTKITDSFFIGDAEAAQDWEFMEEQRISHVVNCSPKELPNMFEAEGITYFVVDWEDMAQQKLFDEQTLEPLTSLVHFLRDVIENDQRCLIHSMNGISRAPTCFILYFMSHFKWSLLDSMNFVSHFHPQTQPNSGFWAQLQKLDKFWGTETKAWTLDRAAFESDGHDQELGDEALEERVLQNTFWNMQLEEAAAEEKKRLSAEPKRLSWLDEKQQEDGTACPIERPPNPSYSSLSPGDGWIDLDRQAPPPPAPRSEQAQADVSDAASVGSMGSVVIHTENDAASVGSTGSVVIHTENDAASVGSTGSVVIHTENDARVAASGVKPNTGPVALAVTDIEDEMSSPHPEGDSDLPSELELDRAQEAGRDDLVEIVGERKIERYGVVDALAVSESEARTAGTAAEEAVKEAPASAGDPLSQETLRAVATSPPDLSPSVSSLDRDGARAIVREEDPSSLVQQRDVQDVENVKQQTEASPSEPVMSPQGRGSFLRNRLLTSLSQGKESAMSEAPAGAISVSSDQQQAEVVPLHDSESPSALGSPREKGTSGKDGRKTTEYRGATKASRSADLVRETPYDYTIGKMLRTNSRLLDLTRQQHQTAHLPRGEEGPSSPPADLLALSKGSSTGSCGNSVNTLNKLLHLPRGESWTTREGNAIKSAKSGTSGGYSLAKQKSETLVLQAPAFALQEKISESLRGNASEQHLVTKLRGYLLVNEEKSPRANRELDSARPPRQESRQARIKTSTDKVKKLLELSAQQRARSTQQGAGQLLIKKWDTLPKCWEKSAEIRDSALSGGQPQERDLERGVSSLPQSAVAQRSQGKAKKNPTFPFQSFNTSASQTKSNSWRKEPTSLILSDFIAVDQASAKPKERISTNTSARAGAPQRKAVRRNSRQQAQQVAKQEAEDPVFFVVAPCKMHKR